MYSLDWKRLKDALSYDNVNPELILLLGESGIHFERLTIKDKPN